jgi:hypothetical protein
MSRLTRHRSGVTYVVNLDTLSSTAKAPMGLQQCFVEAFCCLSPLPVSTPLPLTLREVYD